MIQPYWTSSDGRHVIYCDDCRNVLPHIGKVDAVVTDPPYGIDLGAYIAPNGLEKQRYESYDDTIENLRTVVVPSVRDAVALCGRGLVFCGGTNIGEFDKPDAVGGVFIPAGAGRSTWGFTTLAHFLLYGRHPALQNGCTPTTWSSNETAEKTGHPCNKPVGWMQRCVRLASLEGETILDPFMGSGTTGVACEREGRRFIGIEIEKKYCDIAIRRIEEAMQTLWRKDEPKDVQLELT